MSYKDPEKRRAYQQQRRKENPDLYRKYRKSYEDRHRKEITERSRDRKKAWYAANRKRILREKREQYIRRKPVNPDSHDPKMRREQRLAYLREYYLKNIDKHRALQKAWYQVNKSLVRAKVAKWRKLNEASVREKAKSHYRENKHEYAKRAHEYYLAHGDDIRNRVRDWRQRNPEKVHELRMRRRAREQLVVLTEAEAEERNAFIRGARQAYRVPCWWCHAKTTKTNRHIDHIVPLSRGGTDHAYNLCVACQSCNQRKHNKLPHEFMKLLEMAFT